MIFILKSHILLKNQPELNKPVWFEPVLDPVRVILIKNINLRFS
jgi:hypothetical protein